MQKALRMVNESCLGFDPKFLELKEEVHVRKREEERGGRYGEKREVHVHERIFNFYCTMHVYFSSSLLISSFSLPPIGPYSSN